MTLKRIATHTACLPAQPPGIFRSWWRDRSNPWANFSGDALLRGLRTTKPPRELPAAAAWRYSNFGYALLGAVLERRTGQSYASLVDAWIARPYGLTSLHVGGHEQGGALWPLTTGSGRSAVAWDLQGPVRAAGALRGSMDDLLRWGMLVADPPSALGPVLELVRASRVDIARPMGPMIASCLGWGVCKLPGTAREVWAHEGATSGSFTVLTVSRGGAPSVVAFARNRGLSMRSMLDSRTRAVGPALLTVAKMLSDV